MTLRRYDSYEDARESFNWGDVYADADWDAPGELNVAHEVCDRHAAAAPDRTALRWVGADDDPGGGPTETVTFAALRDRSNRFANVLDEYASAGDRVITFMPRIPEHYVAMVGTLKTGAVFGGINERFGPDGIAYRIGDCDARVVVTTADNRETVARAVEEVPSVETIIVVDRDGLGVGGDDVDYHAAVEAASSEYDVARTSGEDDALIYYTSGTTGPAKGVLHRHRWVAGVAATQLLAVDVTPDDCYWSTGDLGWLTGPINTLGAWFWGTTMFADEGEFEPQRLVTLLDEHPISILFSVPTVYRMLRANDDLFEGTTLDVRHALSIGEPISAGVVEWGHDRLGVSIYDTYGQTETGNMIINNYPFMEVRPGSMGRPLPGVEASVVDPDTGEVLDPGETGVIAERGNFPCFFAGYWKKPEQTADRFVDGPDGEWYLSGDLGSVDEDGYFWFEGRADDVIISAGYRIGPFEVEASLGEHPAVAEAAVVPKPDEERGNIVKAFVVLNEGYEPGPDLEEEIRLHVRNELAAHEYPREFTFVEELPKTVTGKIRRTELRDRVDEN